MDIIASDIRSCILVRGTRSSTTSEMVNSYCEAFGQINYSRNAINSQGIMRGYNVVFKQEQSVNRFMDDRPHRIDGQSVKVRRCIPADEEWRLTNQILITSSDNSNDKQLFNEHTLRDYFSRYGPVRTCQIDTYHNRPCAYLSFTDYDRVDQLINDKPHTINKIMINVHKYIAEDDKISAIPSKQAPKHNLKRHQHSSNNSDYSRKKQHRSSSSSNNTDTSSTTLSSKVIVKQKSSEDNEFIRLKNANEVLIREVQSLMCPSVQTIETTTTNHPEISRLQYDYQRLHNQTINLRNEQNDKLSDNHTKEILSKLYNDVEILLKHIKNMQEPNKTFADELFDKYTLEYILSLSENDVQQRREQLEKENQLLLLIKQNMPYRTVPKM